MRVSLLIFLLGLFLNFGVHANSRVHADYSSFEILSRNLPINIPEANNLNSSDFQTLQCLAWNLYFEARGQGREEQTAIAWIPINRTRSPIFSNNICDNVFHYLIDQRARRRYQFSWVRNPFHRNWRREDAAWTRVQQISYQVLRGTVSDPGRGAMYFHIHNLENPWAPNSRKIRIGAHVFWPMSR